MREIILIAHNIRSCHNVGSLLRTAEGLGVKSVYLTGYTPYPTLTNDERLPHISQKLTRQIQKTALGAEKLVAWTYEENVFDVISKLRSEGFQVAGLEQHRNSVSLPNYPPPEKLVLLLGSEVTGIDESLQQACDLLLEIPMTGKKESFNVIQATAMALYHCRFFKS